MTTVTMIAPASFAGQVSGPAGATYVVDKDGKVTVDAGLVVQLLSAGFKFFRTSVLKAVVRAPSAADLVYIKAAATPATGVITIAKQPDQARKLAVRVVIDTTHAITVGKITLVGTDQDGNALSEDVSLVTTTSVTLKTVNAFATLTSGTVSNDLAATGGQGSNTLGIGQAADLAIPGAYGAAALTLLKATKVVSTFTGAGTAVTDVSVLPVDDVAATATVDTAARTVSPTTAPGATATTSTDFEFTYSAGLAD